MRPSALALFSALCVALSGSSLEAQRVDPFQHGKHAGLFPLCTGCHAMQGDRATDFPPTTQCTGCHDGRDQKLVDWTPPPPRATLLDYDHPAHVRAMGDEPSTCEGCHVVPGADRMEVARRAEVGNCLSCHAHEAPEHLTAPNCSTCHRSLAESRLPLSRLLELPAPPDHAAQDFVLGHDSGPSCSVCHTRERCTTCHVNAATVSGITAIPTAPAGMELPRYAAHYPEPASHAPTAWLTEHAADAAEPASCSTCHARESCVGCHAPPLPRGVTALPSRRTAPAQGVDAVRLAPASHDAGSFARQHAEEAATAGTSCTACHERTSCAECHASGREAVFHPGGFLERHSIDAFARRLECANCHDRQAFCADCHRSSGRLPVGVTGVIYHDAEGVWLLRHGQAARQGLESCVSCHRQQDCLQCHSQLGAFRVNPHGRDFDAERARQRNPFVCRTCHLRDPLGGGGG